ncbi:MAG: branched-chain amino acid ABC transporter permease [Erysipelotrichaceae bacterium]|jgi:branched-chain amino acid transport system permease protein|nr:branched-chain amino acid ABC transporter permease [Erysipelotrichaceae bacterium]MCH4045782.1 branched-chain amino acid ABC transporter permease [Erysipelotrichaceae bacterium]MCH4122990.1 branched-chain amino acid ABC transporter permease [Erysipelotrichaceae bacterium]MCI1384691.1 branched-chain amino acid ABC transporter permease [Solobacterium sp.]
MKKSVNKSASFEQFYDAHKKVILSAVALILFLVPFMNLERLTTRILIMILLYAVLGLGLNVLLGYVGQVSLGHAGFFAIGAYITAVLSTKTGMNWWLAALIATAGTGLVGYLLFLPTYRVSGDYLTIVTLGFGYIVTMVLQRWESVTNGNYGIRGIPAPKFFGIKLTLANGGLYWLILIIFALVLVFCHVLKNSATGRAMTAVREDELAAKMMGIKTQKYKMEAFIISAAITGLGGSFYAVVNNGFIEPTNFSFDVSTTILEIVIIGGMGTLRGPILGAAIIELFPQVFRFLNQWRFVVFGVILILIMRYRPQGLLGWNTTLPYKIPKKAEELMEEEEKEMKEAE